MISEFVQITRRDRFQEEEFYPMVHRMYEEIWTKLLPPQLVTDQLSSRIKNNVVTPPDAPIPDCLTCGACCQSLLLSQSILWPVELVLWASASGLRGAKKLPPLE